ncbi:hypothetical protein BS50DRAFT_479382 [Corynespora cassiicola Philippines]|uniref:Histidine kinase HHK8p n=1 Tax=Corynespora cassiicola Philippines TaxID=1448308 RepID=A0A2T2PAP1_CORCC|nr:hypothetical protein BS50DRAFT_479382 [Corynespora cassiicola Philippines]
MPRQTVIDVDILEADPAPTFVIKIQSTAIAFEILFCNEAFRKRGLQELVLADDRSALLFRSWAQATFGFETTHALGGRIWHAEVAGRNGSWKVVKATGFVDATAQKEEQSERCANSAGKLELSKEMENPLPFRLGKTHLTARLESMQRMMEMSEVGVFEYKPSGQLIHANDAWYRLSSHPKNLPAHCNYSFIDLVVPEDRSLVMSMWNTLVEGRPVTFEMRWKPRPGSDDRAQWVLCACVPVFDSHGQLISIAGNTVDINGQKKAQEEAAARVEALERARASERKFMRFAQSAPVAIYILTPDKGVQYVNDQFFELVGNPSVPYHQLNWDELVFKEDTEKLETMWSDLSRGIKTEHLQFRLNRTWVDQEGVRSQVWVEASSYPDLDETGAVRGIMGTLFDISQFKWAENVAKRRIEEALEAKRQQENFIDMTSHELRNPLSAIIQCADAVISSLHQFIQPGQNSIHPQFSSFNNELSTCIESLQTIVSCSLHQKRIIDDVLTLSKLDSNLILITPTRVEASVVVSEALKMFEVECVQFEIALEFIVDKSLQGLEWVMLDPSRLLQVLINLLTNAIKFTKDRPARKIEVTLGGSWVRPPKVWESVTFTNGDVSSNNLIDNNSWGEGREGYIWLKVKDTGCGITEDEQKRLFSRFSQATPRTHIKYGGSGLGLFISKSLTSLQGGSIGVHSEPSKGSTFAFYVSTRVAKPPTEANASLARPPIGYRKLSLDEAMKSAGINVLLVEDNLVNQKVLSKQLQKAGCNVSVAGNGLEALEWLKQTVYWRVRKLDGIQGPNKHKLDIILLDIEMPVMDGLTCARLIRNYEHQGLLATSTNPDTEHASEATIEQKKRLPILAVSANARGEQIEQALQAGMDDAITKPFRIPELWPKMEGLISRIKNRGHVAE